MSTPPGRRRAADGPAPTTDPGSGGFFGRRLELRVPANLIFLIVVAAGVFSLNGMPVVEFPNVAFDQIEVRVAFPGASAIEVERLVAKKLEEEIEEVKELDWIRSPPKARLADPATATARVLRAASGMAPACGVHVPSTTTRHSSLPLLSRASPSKSKSDAAAGRTARPSSFATLGSPSA